jgi:hypothetical protein
VFLSAYMDRPAPNENPDDGAEPKVEPFGAAAPPPVAPPPIAEPFVLAPPVLEPPIWQTPIALTQPVLAPSPFVLQPLPATEPSHIAKPVTPVKISPLVTLLAGIETGVLGGVLMVLWFGANSTFAGQRWWAMLNLYGGSVYGDRTFQTGFGLATAAGFATQVLLQVVGAVAIAFLLVRLRKYWAVTLAASALGTCWYFLCQWSIWGMLYDRVPQLTPQPATLIAHLLFTATLCRIPRRALQLAANWSS